MLPRTSMSPTKERTTNKRCVDIYIFWVSVFMLHACVYLSTIENTYHWSVYAIRSTSANCYINPRRIGLSTHSESVLNVIRVIGAFNCGGIVKKDQDFDEIFWVFVSEGRILFHKLH